MTAAEAVKIVADRLNVTRAEVIEALVYNLVIEEIGAEIEFLRIERKAGRA
jgi:NACalpha-BTF3-like transcription factor